MIDKTTLLQSASANEIHFYNVLDGKLLVTKYTKRIQKQITDNMKSNSCGIN